MDRSYPYSRRLTRRTQLQKRLAAVAALGVAGCAVLYTLTAPSPAATPASLTAAVAAASASTPAQAPQAGPRRVYPYSIVPGGVADARELRRVIREDKVVAAHYAEFDMSRAHEKTVATPRAVHVSYRKGDKVYWTAKKVMLAEGETLLSDGTHEARARCANQISDTARLPVEAHGPSAEELDASVVGADSAEGGLENVSAAMLDGQGAPGGFLHAPGSGTAGGILAGGGAEAGSLFATAASVPGAPRGAFRSSGSGSGSSGSGAGNNGGTDNGDNGDGGAGNSGGSSPATPVPDSGTPGTGTPGSSTPGTPQPGPSQPSTPTTPGNPSSGAGPETPGGTPSTPSKPSQPLPSTPDGEQEGGGDNTVPTVPSTDSGGNPAPGGTPVTPGIPEGGPDSSPLPQPSIGGDPQEPTKPVEEPAKPVEVPEPGTIWLVGAALGLMLLQRRYARRS